MVLYTDHFHPPDSWLRRYNYLSPSTSSKTMLWYPLLEGNVNKSQPHQLGDSCYCLCRGLDSGSVVLNSIDSQRKWPQKKKKKNDAGMFVKTLLNTAVIWKNDLSWNIAGRGVWLMQPRFSSSSWFLGSARLQYVSFHFGSVCSLSVPSVAEGRHYFSST